MGKYDDIIHLSRPYSAQHPPMSNAERAKQFMPFAALRGYDEAISQREVLYTPLLELGEEQRDALDARLRQIKAALDAGRHPRLTVEYFVVKPDNMQNPPLGQYHTRTGRAEKMNLETGEMRLDGQWLPLEDVTGVWEEEEGKI